MQMRHTFMPWQILLSLMGFRESDEGDVYVLATPLASIELSNAWPPYKLFQQHNCYATKAGLLSADS